MIGNEGYMMSGDGNLMPTKKDQPAPDLRAPRTMTIFSPDRSPIHRDGDFRFIWR
jgi:hypothetical protein